MEKFNYTYSAMEQEEIKKIRDKYIVGEEDKMQTLRKLDQGVTQKSTMYSIVVGVIGALVMGIGMSCCLEWQGIWFVPGIIIGIIGMILIALAYPVYNYITRKERERIAPEILRLTDELMK